MSCIAGILSNHSQILDKKVTTAALSLDPREKLNATLQILLTGKTTVKLLVPPVTVKTANYPFCNCKIW